MSSVYPRNVILEIIVSAFKEKIAAQIGLPVEQQRLIFRGNLKDDHLLSKYHVENGHTLHSVERQSSQPQPSSGSNIGDASSNNSGRVDGALLIRTTSSCKILPRFQSWTFKKGYKIFTPQPPISIEKTP